jgi:hypothetical protein
MSATAAAVFAAIGAAVALPRGRPGVDRLARALPGYERGRRRGPTPRRALPLAGIVAATLLLGPAGAVLLTSAAVARRVWRRGAPGRLGRRRAGAVRQAAPLAYDLLATCVEVGLTLPVAARVVASSVGEPVGPTLAQLAAALERGAPIDEAVHGFGGTGLEALARTVLAAESGGPGLGFALRALAAEARAAAAASAQAAAKRSGVWAVGPLTLCFLPAFVLVGVVPVVAGLLGDVLR